LRESRYLQTIPGAHYCNLYERRLLDSHAIRYPVDLTFGEDQVFQAVALARAGRVAVIEDVVYVYHHYRMDSLTRRPPSLKNLLDDVDFHRRIGLLFLEEGLGEAARRYVGYWSYSIREYWLSLPGRLPMHEVSTLFGALRKLLAEFGVEPWNAHTPPHHRHLLELVVAGRDDEALAFLATEAARTGFPAPAAPNAIGEKT
jgi:hypothetical protein